MTAEDALNPAALDATIWKYDITPATRAVTVVDSVATSVALDVRTPVMFEFDERNHL
jgi:hypothetical protein